ncbi:MAG: DUF1829 domain-containing protein [Deltaproteobacteria bacterium]|nr:DUF1829 domain-containing protein [Deltaproteobacteria bacterium]
MIGEIQILMEEYRTWLRDKTSLRQVRDWVEITTPYLDRHNDYLQIYVKRQNGNYLLTDDGYILDDLQLSGCKIESQNRQMLLKITLNGFGVEQNKERLEVHASPDNFAEKKHNLIQAMLAVNDMFFLAGPTVTSLFLEDVESWLEECEIRYTPRAKFAGKSGFDHLFNFVIPKSRENPERILKVINKPTRDQAQTVAFSWLDTKKTRPADSRAYAILNDTDQQITAQVLDALHTYDIRPVSWSKREEVRLELAA